MTQRTARPTKNVGSRSTAKELPGLQSNAPSRLSIAQGASYRKFIDGLRGIAILMVIAVHTSIYVGNDHAGSFHIAPLEQLVTNGARGVQLFFVLSALTLFNSSAHRFARDTYPKLSFWLRRGFRILPFWWLTNAYDLVRGSMSVRSALPSLLFYFGFIRYKTGVEIVPGGWSLFTEETFYAFMPFLFYKVRNLKDSVFLCLVLYLISWVWELFYPVTPAANDFQFLFPLTHWLCFGLGIVAFFLIETEMFKKIAPDKTFAAIADVIVLIATVELFATPTIYQFDMRVQSLVPFLMVLAAAFDHSVMRRIAESSVLGLYGTCCYSLYLLHVIILSSLQPFLPRFLALLGLSGASVDVKFAVWYPVVALVGLGAGLVSFICIERPCVRAGKRVISWVNERGTLTRKTAVAAKRTVA
jgi:peptidoglycan/LPS O-acetylase OafA/YrhL